MCNLLIADVVQEGSNKKSISLSDIWDMLNKISVKLDKHIADSEVRFNRIEVPGNYISVESNDCQDSSI